MMGMHYYCNENEQWPIAQGKEENWNNFKLGLLICTLISENQGENFQVLQTWIFFRFNNNHSFFSMWRLRKKIQVCRRGNSMTTWTQFGLFLTTTYLYVDIFNPEHGQKWHFLDHLPPLLSHWTSPCGMQEIRSAKLAILIWHFWFPAWNLNFFVYKYPELLWMY